MCASLGRDCGLDSMHCLTDCNEWTSGRRLHVSFLVEVVQNSFPSSLVARNHQNRCCALA
jgi:hypothetical protein